MPRLLATMAIVSFVHCTEATTNAPGKPAGDVASLQVMRTSVKQGDTITVIGAISPGGRAQTLGSYVATLKYTPGTLRYLDALPLPGVSSATNGGAAGTVRLAAAAPAGFPGGRLFAIRFRELTPGGVQTLSLSLGELSDVAFGNRLASLTVVPGVTTLSSSNEHTP
jgi:hypothetical protein